MNFRTEETTRQALRRLPFPAPPADLELKLRVIASREAERRRSRRTISDIWKAWKNTTGFLLGTMMKPLAVPAFGGLSAAVVMFSIFVPGLAIPRPTDDVPTMLTTVATVKGLAPVGYHGVDEIVLDLMIDGEGRMVDYAVVSGPEALNDPRVRRGLETNLLFTQFTPATAFGLPAISRIRLSIRASSIDVRG
ncbi:MAG: hypothetical protein K2X35_06830 [Bryobacteraceae bacterium]|nr:hypothetical protein [Bryobacteraceae bacterium]